MKHLMLFSAVYLILASMCPLMGFHTLKLQPKAPINRLFFAISLCLATWALGYAVVIVAPYERVAVFWTRIAAFGYCSIYSLLLHLTLHLTGHARALEKKWALPLLYLPSAAFVYAFAVSPEIARSLYVFERSSVGWTRVVGPTAWDILFRIYFIAVMIACLTLLWRWIRAGVRQGAPNLSRALICAFVASFALGAFADMRSGLLFRLPIPLAAPVLCAIPLAAIIQMLDKRHRLNARSEKTGERILDDNLRRMVFRVSSIGLILGGAALFALEHFWWSVEDPVLTIFASSFLVGLGAFILFAERTHKGYASLEMLLIAAILSITPILAINMANLGGMTMWAFPLMLTFCALVFNSTNMLFASGVSALFSQLYLLGVAPQRLITIDHRTYFGRIIILAFILCVAYYVHRVYLRRLRENAEQARFQSLISAVVISFSQANKESAEGRVRELLALMATHYQSETVLVCAVDDAFSALTGIHTACADGQTAGAEQFEAAMRRWEAYRRENPAGDLPEMAPKKGGARADRRARSPWLIVPILMGEEPIAFLYVEAAQPGSLWRDQLTLLPTISRVVSSAMEKLSSEARIQFMAYYDALTRLPNRQLFLDRAEQAIHLARRNNTALGILFLDLDFFKSINDTMGHEGGDMLIQTVSRKLTDTLRKSDTVARYAGDEFLVLINNIVDADDIEKVADKVMAIFQQPMRIKGQEIFITASAGISVFPADGEDANTLVKHADIAMYTAKEKGKNQYAFCSGNMKEMVEYRVNLANSLYRALERRELVVYYQPQIDLRTEKIIGLEALLRWFHPDCGMISPAEFIPLAEQTGLINSIGAWVLETACQQTAAWKADGLGSLRIAVNLSVVQLRNPNLVAQVSEILEKTGIDTAQVELEITESTTMREPDYIIRVLSELKALGISISIDDFGTEYSSLNRLKMLPVDKLKMDIQFVRGIDKSAKDQAIAVVIMNLAKNLEMKLVAEGVESSTQLSFLKSRMCDEVQGYYYYKPMPAAEVEAILRERTRAEV